jgi:hypothetical protein
MVGETKSSMTTVRLSPFRVRRTFARAGWCWKNFPYFGSVRVRVEVVGVVVEPEPGRVLPGDPDRRQDQSRPVPGVGDLGRVLLDPVGPGLPGETGRLHERQRPLDPLLPDLVAARLVGDLPGQVGEVGRGHLDGVAVEPS